MSLETWKAEFYPVEADKATGSDMEALDHSIVKWTGLLKNNLEKHGVEKERLRERLIIFGTDFGTDAFIVNGTSCALCRKYTKVRDDEPDCNECPIWRMTGLNCERKFASFALWDDARPMLTLLKRAKKWLEKQQ